jgi:hypothetical protein
MDLVTLALAKSYTDKEIQKAEMGDIQLDTELGKSGFAADSKAIKEYVDNAISQTSTWTLLHENSYQKVYLADYSNTPIDIEKGKSLASPTSTSYDALTAFIAACYEFCRGNRFTNYNYQAERIAQNGAILVSEGVLTGSLKISVSASANRNEYRNLSLIRAAKEGKKCWLITDNTDGSGARVATIFEDGTIGANTCPLTDSTLSVEGVPADAKVVGEILATKQPLGNYALKEEIPIKNSQLENDSGFLTEAPVTSVNGQRGDIVLSAEDFNAEVSGTSAALLSTHNTSTEAHNDIRLEIKDLADRLTAFFDSDDATLD